jgi:hypothetical protein
MQCPATIAVATSADIADIGIADIRQIVERRNRAANVRRQQRSPFLEAQFDQRSIIQRDAKRVVSGRRGLSGLSGLNSGAFTRACPLIGVQYANR